MKLWAYAVSPVNWALIFISFVIDVVGGRTLTTRGHRASVVSGLQHVTIPRFPKARIYHPAERWDEQLGEQGADCSVPGLSWDRGIVDRRTNQVAMEAPGFA